MKVLLTEVMHVRAWEGQGARQQFVGDDAE